MKRLIICLVLLFSIQFHFIQADETAELTVIVDNLYGEYIDNAIVSVNYVYPQDDDPDIEDQFTKRGVATFYLETEREYIVTVTKAGFQVYTERLELEEDTSLSVTLEYTQTVPVLHMKRYSVSPKEVSPGEIFKVSVVIENEGTGDALTVKVSFDSSENFSPVQPSTSAYLGRLDAREITSLNQTFAVSGEALSGVYDVTLIITYVDAANQTYTVQETVGVTILRIPLVKLLNVDYPSEAGEGESFTFSVEIANTGRFTVNGLYLEVESDMDWEYSSYYVGSLEAGDFDTFTSEVVPETPGERTFVIRVGFTDDFNREHSEEYTFPVVVTESAPETTSPPQDEGFWARLIEFLKGLLGLG